MPQVRDLVEDKDFQALPDGAKQIVFSKVAAGDQEFTGLPMAAREHVRSRIFGSGNTPQREDLQAKPRSVAEQAKQHLAGDMGESQIGKTEGPSIGDQIESTGYGRRVIGAGRAAMEGVKTLAAARPEDLPTTWEGANRTASAVGSIISAPFLPLTAIPGALTEDITGSPMAGNVAEIAGGLALGKVAPELMGIKEGQPEQGRTVIDPENGNEVVKNVHTAADEAAAAKEAGTSDPVEAAKAFAKDEGVEAKISQNPDLPVSKTEGDTVQLAADAGPAEAKHELEHVASNELGTPEPQEDSGAAPAQPEDSAKPLEAGPGPGEGTTFPKREEPITGEVGQAAADLGGRPGAIAPEIGQTTMRATASKSVANAFRDMVTSGQVQYDPVKPPTLQIQNALADGTMKPDQFQAILDKHGINEVDFATNFGLSVSDGARQMANMAELKRQLAAEGFGEGMAKVDPPPEWWLYYYGRRMGRTLQAAVVTGVAKTIRNSASHYLLSGPMASLEMAFKAGLQEITTQITGRTYGENEVTLADAWENLAEAGRSYNGGAAAISKNVLSAFPTQGNRLYGQFLADVAANGRGDKPTVRLPVLHEGLDAADKVLDIANFGLHWNTEQIRSGSFKVGVDQMLRQRGLGGIEDFASHPQDIPYDIIAKSVSNSLKRSWGYAPQRIGARIKSGEFTPMEGVKPPPMEDAAARVIDAMNGIPFSRLIVKFPRFMYNSTTWMAKHSPLGLLQFAKPEVRQAFANGDMSVVSDVLTGGTIAYAFSALDNAYGTGKPLEYKVGKDTYTLEPWHPLTFWSLYGYGINAAAGKRQAPYFKEALKLFQGPDSRGGPLATLENVDEMQSAFQADKKQAMGARLAGQALAGYFVPLNELLNTPISWLSHGPQPFGETGEQLKETKSSNVLQSFVRPIQEKIPGLRESLPNRGEPTRNSQGGDRQSFLGAEGYKNPAELELGRLGIRPDQVFRKTGVPEVDNAIAQEMGPLFERYMGGFVKSKQYQAYPDNQRPYILSKRMVEVRKAAVEAAAGKNPQLFSDAKLLRTPAFEQLYLESDPNMKQFFDQSRQRVEAIR